MYRSSLLAVVFLTLVPNLSSCTSMQLADMFSGYAKQMLAVRSAQLSGDFTTAQKLLGDKNQTNNNYSLSLLEKGRLQYLGKDWSQSQQSFGKVITQIQEEQDKAKIQLSRGMENLAAVVSSDNAIRYDIPAYERSMLHTYQALNYLHQYRFEDALVEVRRANLVQQQALEDNQNTLYDAESNFNQQAMNKAYPTMDKLIGKLKNGFQNAYTFYLSAILYEAAGQPNDAYIDYKKALEIYPDNRYLQQDVVRLATSLGMQDEREQFVKLYGEHQQTADSNFGEVVIIVEQGVINAKQEQSINLPIFTRSNDARFFSFALPVYSGSLSQYKPLALHFADKTYQSQELVRLQSLASKSLQDQWPSLISRQVVRLLAKEQLRRKMSQEGGDLGNILATLYNITSERADTRSWLTLPDSVQLVRLTIPAGKQSLSLNIGAGAQPLDIEVKPKGIALVTMSVIGSYNDYQISYL
jgi:uncharacterized protein